MSDLRIIETCACGASIDVTGGRYRNDNYPNNPRGAEEVVERWRVEHKHRADAYREGKERTMSECSSCLHAVHEPERCASPSSVPCACGPEGAWVPDEVQVREAAVEWFGWVVSNPEAAFDRWLEEVQREAAEKAWNQAVGRALEITQTEYLIGDGLLTVIGNPYAAEAYRGEKNK